MSMLPADAHRRLFESQPPARTWPPDLPRNQSREGAWIDGWAIGWEEGFIAARKVYAKDTQESTSNGIKGAAT